MFVLLLLIRPLLFPFNNLITCSLVLDLSTYLIFSLFPFYVSFLSTVMNIMIESMEKRLKVVSVKWEHLGEFKVDRKFKGITCRFHNYIIHLYVDYLLILFFFNFFSIECHQIWINLLSLVDIYIPLTLLTYVLNHIYHHPRYLAI